eukprot:1193068-Prorocentrum_minimum.AAC.1
MMALAWAVAPRRSVPSAAPICECRRRPKSGGACWGTLSYSGAQGNLSLGRLRFEVFRRLF